MTKSEALYNFIYGSLSVIVTSENYSDFIEDALCMMPDLRFANGKPLHKWIPVKDVEWVVWIARYPSSSYMAISPYDTMCGDGKTLCIKWSDVA